MKTTVRDLIGELMDAVDDIMLRAQEAEGITDGSVDPIDAYLIDDHIASIAELLMGILEYEQMGILEYEQN